MAGWESLRVDLRRLREESPGAYVGPHTLARVGFAIEPQQSRPVPVLIGTASVVPDLGYAVPPGRWRLVIALQTDSGSMLSAPLDITITP